MHGGDRRLFITWHIITRRLCTRGQLAIPSAGGRRSLLLLLTGLHALDDTRRYDNVEARKALGERYQGWKVPRLAIVTCGAAATSRQRGGT